MEDNIVYERNLIEKDSLRKWIMFMLLFFPVSSMLKVYIGSLNLVLTGLTFILFFLYYLKKGISKKDFFILIYIFLTFAYNIIIWGFYYYEDNMLFYLPFLLIYFGFYIRNSDYILAFMKSHKQYIDAILILWNGIVFISFFFSSSYIYEGETRGFVSFAGTTFLLSAMAVYVFALLVFQYYEHRKKIYMIGLLIPSLSILMGTTRTYLMVLLCAWLVCIYINLRNQKLFIPVMVIGITAFIGIVILSPISKKFINASNRSISLGMNPIEAFTSGRSVFWSYDVNAIFQNSPFKIIFGNGVNWLFNLNMVRFHNPLWAHNDFIQILSDYGVLGLGMYLWSIKRIMDYFLRKKGVSIILILTLVIMWAFNAFFNMFYTYFCAVLSFPFYLLIVRYDSYLRLLRGGVIWIIEKITKKIVCMVYKIIFYSNTYLIIYF